MADVYGERHAEPVRDDRYTVAKSMIERLKQELNDNPEVSFELEVTQLGYDAGLGDRQWTIYEPMGIDFKTRIVARKWYPFTNKSPVVTLGNKKTTFADVLMETRIEIDENKKETRSKFEQTNEKISMEVERLDGDITEAKASFEITADNIIMQVEKLETDLNGAITESKAIFEVTAAQIRSEVTSVQTELNGKIIQANSNITQTASSIRSEVATEVNRVDGRVDSANSSITQLSNSISSKVEQSDFNGNTVASLINQTATFHLFYKSLCPARFLDRFNTHCVAVTRNSLFPFVSSKSAP